LTADFADNADFFFAVAATCDPRKNNATLIERRYNESPAHDVNGENAALMTGEKIIDEVADD